MAPGVVSAAGFRCSLVLRWERPYHTQFPQEILNSDRSIYASVMQDPECVVVVVVIATGSYNPEENTKTEAIIPPGEGLDNPKARHAVLVGVTFWKLEPGSKCPTRIQQRCRFDINQFRPYNAGSLIFLIYLDQAHARSFHRTGTAMKTQCDAETAPKSGKQLTKSKP